MRIKEWSVLISDWVAWFVGTWWFILLFSGTMAFWIFLNALEFAGVKPFDPYPYILLNLVLSTLAAIQAPFIMISQRRAEKAQEAANSRLLTEIKELVEMAIEEEKFNTMITSQMKELVTVLIQEAHVINQLATAATSSKPESGSWDCSESSHPAPPTQVPGDSHRA